jgi:hypothetical protein
MLTKKNGGFGLIDACIEGVLLTAKWVVKAMSSDAPCKKLVWYYI